VENTRLITGHNNYIEKHFDYGVLGDKNTYMLGIENVINSNEFPVVNSDHEPIECKIIYAHPSQLPMSHGTTTATSYSGSGTQSYRKRHVDDSAQLFVAEEPPFDMNGIEFGDINSFLVGDSRDEFLEGSNVKLQVMPQRFN